MRDAGLIPGLGGSPGEGNGNPFQYSCLENSMDRVWQATVHSVTKSQTRLSTSTDLALAASWTSSLPSGAGLFQRIQCKKRRKTRSHLATRRVLWGGVWNAGLQGSRQPWRVIGSRRVGQEGISKRRLSQSRPPFWVGGGGNSRSLYPVISDQLF